MIGEAAQLAPPEPDRGREMRIHIVGCYADPILIFLRLAQHVGR